MTVKIHLTIAEGTRPALTNDHRQALRKGIAAGMGELGIGNGSPAGEMLLNIADQIGREETLVVDASELKRHDLAALVRILRDFAAPSSHLFHPASISAVLGHLAREVEAEDVAAQARLADLEYQATLVREQREMRVQIEKAAGKEIAAAKKALEASQAALVKTVNDAQRALVSMLDAATAHDTLVEQYARSLSDAGLTIEEGGPEYESGAKARGSMSRGLRLRGAWWAPVHAVELFIWLTDRVGKERLGQRKNPSRLGITRQASLLAQIDELPTLLHPPLKQGRVDLPPLAGGFKTKSDYKAAAATPDSAA
ncbi:hypothetical protein [Acrocarpospora sp. B8E8]|uniref:hypothetical protein n=1 Tax=Acrocarpospora sp. B8E8 TaxID=3153572 RepID=UPI00325DEA16